MKHLAGSYLSARVSLEVDQMACEVTATGYLPLVYARGQGAASAEACGMLSPHS
jgi:hypothetical protein